jgi:hypothetical protein
MYAHWAIFKIITHILCLVDEQTTSVSFVLDALLSCAVCNSEYTECLKSYLKLKIQQHRCCTVMKDRHLFNKMCASVEGWLRHRVIVERRHFVRLK